MPRTASADEVNVFESATRDLVGLALRSVDELDISLPQFRLLLTLSEIGPASSTDCARALGVVGSSITRLADRLDASGHLVRGSDASHRSIVTLELTELGRSVVAQVNMRRRTELASVLDQLAPEARAQCASALRDLHEILGAKLANDDLRRHLPF